MLCAVKPNDIRHTYDVYEGDGTVSTKAGRAFNCMGWKET